MNFDYLQYKYILRNKGIATESDYPYNGVDGTCWSKMSEAAAHIRGFHDVLANTVANQPVSVSVAVNRNFQSYSGGIFKGPCGTDLTDLNHAVTVIGYGTTEYGKKYWLIKNSWGESWGENGYMRLLRGSGKHGGLRSVSETMEDKLHRQEGNSSDHQLRPLNDRLVIKEVGCRDNQKVCLVIAH
ncbi:unnamed protein product [Sphenostylis stenocarpa]|uniref:Peptidase C1A papain C-terminal domain-containing protein n=1 Tax=Sphenostylis stenocarpa TaxID=92480 RepID=A0AA86VNR6_9FABA|nr:unnamed protein product [Sphenostylis stenocarpa]